jgi:hypothetical protein
MNPHSQKEDEQHAVECCICINSMAPFQALFLAPCSHCFHYKCVTTLLGAGFMFQCPLCRQVANLEASVAEPEAVSEMVSEPEEGEEELDDDMDGHGPERKATLNSPDGEELGSDVEMNNLGMETVEPLNRPLIFDSSAAVNIPGTLRNITGLETALSPSTPQNINIMAHQRTSPTAFQRRPADVPVLMFNTLTKLTQVLSSGDDQSITSTIDEYGEQMKTLISGITVSEEEKEALLSKIVSSLRAL